ncbi:hypothetical protein IWQ61_007677 [Dispira simplex]|nr:hypothetical protein IWQ61_007677 [Dispira simplex]
MSPPARSKTHSPNPVQRPGSLFSSVLQLLGYGSPAVSQSPVFHVSPNGTSQNSEGKQDNITNQSDSKQGSQVAPEPLTDRQVPPMFTPVQTQFIPHLPAVFNGPEHISTGTTPHHRTNDQSPRSQPHPKGQPITSKFFDWKQVLQSKPSPVELNRRPNTPMGAAHLHTPALLGNCSLVNRQPLHTATGRLKLRNSYRGRWSATPLQPIPLVYGAPIDQGSPGNHGPPELMMAKDPLGSPTQSNRNRVPSPASHIEPFYGPTLSQWGSPPRRGELPKVSEGQQQGIGGKRAGVPDKGNEPPSKRPRCPVECRTRRYSSSDVHPPRYSPQDDAKRSVPGTPSPQNGRRHQVPVYTSSPPLLPSSTLAAEPSHPVDALKPTILFPRLSQLPTEYTRPSGDKKPGGGHPYRNISDLSTSAVTPYDMSSTTSNTLVPSHGADKSPGTTDPVKSHASQSLAQEVRELREKVKRLTERVPHSTTNRQSRTNFPTESAISQCPMPPPPLPPAPATTNSHSTGLARRTSDGTPDQGHRKLPQGLAESIKRKAAQFQIATDQRFSAYQPTLTVNPTPTIAKRTEQRSPPLLATQIEDSEGKPKECMHRMLQEMKHVQLRSTEALWSPNRTTVVNKSKRKRDPPTSWVKYSDNNVDSSAKRQCTKPKEHGEIRKTTSRTIRDRILALRNR